MPPVIEASAQRRIDSFQKVYGEAALDLACHAALPTALTPRLVHLLRVNFFLDIEVPLPYTSEADLLLSPLCREVGEELYDMEPTVRNLLLKRLWERYPQDRVRAVAILLWRYMEKCEPWPDMPNLERAQQFTAFSFLSPKSALDWLETNSQKENSSSDNQAWYIAMRREQEIIKPPDDVNTKNFLVFISGKISSMFSERSAIRDALARRPDVETTGLETLRAMGTPTRDLIMDEVVRSDIYLGLFGSYYGKGGTDNEYRVARSLNKHCLIYFKSDTPRVSQLRQDEHSGRIRTLELLKNEMGPNQPVKVFRNTEELVDLVLSDIETIIAGESPSESEIIDNGRLEFQELAEKYEDLRRRMQGGNQRTRLMWNIVSQIKEIAEQKNSSLLEEFMLSSSPGERLVAVVMLQLSPSANYLIWLAERFRIDKPFIQYQAGVALTKAAEELDIVFLSQIQHAIEMATAYVPKKDVNGHRMLLRNAADRLKLRMEISNGKEHENEYQPTSDVVELNDRQEREHVYLSVRDDINETNKNVESDRSPNRFADAESFYRESLEMYRQTGDVQSRALTLSRLGQLHYDQGNWIEAENAYQLSLHLFRELGDRSNVGKVFVALGQIYISQGQLDQSQECLMNARYIYRELNDIQGQSHTLYMLGIVYQNQGRWSEAEQAYLRCLALYRSLGDRRGEAQVLHDVGYLYEALGRKSEAISIFELFLAIQQELGDKVGQSQAQFIQKAIQEPIQMQLTGKQSQQLHEALLSAFPTRESLARMVRFGMDIHLDEIVPNDSLSTIVFALIEWARAQGRWEELVEQAAIANPGNSGLKTFIASLQPQRDATIDVPAAQPAANVSMPVQSPARTRNVLSTMSQNSTTDTASIELFYSYSHKDEALRAELETHLSVLRRQGYITGWHDRKIGAGEKWAGEIDDHLNSARIILLLVSADFLASDYCYDKEMKRALERHESGEARVIPIILRPVDWHAAPFSMLQALPTDAKPVVSWSNRDEAFTNVAQGVRRVIEHLRTP